MSESIGKQLRQARLKRGLTVEDIAHETRIQQDKLRSLEEDDYSTFPSPTYARSFLSIYSEFLEVDASEVLEAITEGGLGGNLDALKSTFNLTPSDQTIPIFKGREEPKQNRPVVMVLLFVLLVVLVPTVYLIGKRMAIQEITEQASTEDANSRENSEAPAPSTAESVSPEGDATSAVSKPKTESDMLNELIWTPDTASDADARVTPTTPPPTGQGVNLIAPTARPIPIPPPEETPEANVSN